MDSIRQVSVGIACCVAVVFGSRAAARGADAPGEQGHPNVLIIMADDCTYNDLPAYGGKNAKTPHLDKLAAESLVFNRAYLCEAMCQPCRAELYSGRFPLNNGCAWNHSASRPTITSMPQQLGALGYRVGLAGKLHVQPQQAFPFEHVDGFDSNCVRSPTQPHDTQSVRKFIGEKGPFCLVVALVEPHVPWVMGDASQYPPRQIKLPPNIADTPLTRESYGRYLAEITYMDGQVGELLEVLEQSGRAADTLVLFSSEQGSQFPGCKWTNWDTGVHTALMARWPGQVAAGTRSDAIVQYADVLPTLIEAAGGKASPELDGRSFLPVLKGKSAKHRELAFGVHNNVPEGPPYPVRTVTNGQFRYIRNLRPEEIYIERHLMGRRGDGRLNNAYWATWVWAASDKPDIYNLVRRYTRRPAEHLYHTAEDPYELKNLADDPQYAAIKTELSQQLDRWMESQGDPGAAVDTTDALEAAKRGEHLHGQSKAAGKKSPAARDGR
ncbi:MAG: sulfatase [Planctomycetales bacterium]|nr:sulfatase [Planctomycetales bacterium]